MNKIKKWTPKTGTILMITILSFFASVIALFVPFLIHRKTDCQCQCEIRQKPLSQIIEKTAAHTTATATATAHVPEKTSVKKTFSLQPK
jgi:hypothetical protein